MKRISFFGVSIDPFTIKETLEKISEIIEKRQITQHVVVNVAKLVYAQKDERLRNIINSCGLINVDGAGIILGAKFLGINIPERVTGIDLMEKLTAYSAKKGYKIYFFGAKEHIVQAVIKTYKQLYPELIIAGYRNGYYSPEEEGGIAENIKNSRADILFVAMGSPEKEIFISKYLDKMQVPFVMGVGGSFDVVAGKVHRAPALMQKYGMEWLYRLYQEPRRLWKRYLVTNTIFLIMLIRQFFKQNFNYAIPDKISKIKSYE
ncbi:MAG: Lipopolysaccharide biosynthesis protein [uncultured bacterium]|nr:MAG: Lipopolysaccharide biosynthesis protein [uncultured bacterium]HBH17435.1 glycosyltransferase [Cyanobacteria bacterium UBA9579]